MTGVDNPEFGNRPSFSNDFLPRLSVDEEQLLNVLTQVDEQLAEYGEFLVLEVAEKTYAEAYWNTDIGRNQDHDRFVVYTEQRLESLQEAMPESVFNRMEGGKTHDLYVGSVVVRLVTGESHAIVRLFETDFEYLDIGCPSEESVYRTWADHQRE